jgi:hypothetical protein
MSCGQHDSTRAALRLDQIGSEFLAFAVERCERFVEQPERAPNDLQSRQRQALLLPGGKILAGKCRTARETGGCEGRGDIL